MSHPPHMLGELIDGARQWRTWSRMGWADVRRRYRRTVIGPFWTTLSLSVFVITMGFLYSTLWNTPPETYLPFLLSGMICWYFLTGVITDGCMVFIANASIISQMPFNLTVLAYAAVWRHIIIVLHNLLAYLVVAVLLGNGITIYTPLAIVGFFLLAINGVWVCILFGLLCARYRDIQQVVMSLLQISLFVTPIFWAPEQLGARGQVVAYLNPLYHMIDVVRAPLLGNLPNLWSYVVLLTLAVVGWSLSITLYKKYRHLIVFWL